MGRLKSAMPEEYFEVKEAYDNGELSHEEYVRLSKKMMKEAFEKVLNEPIR